MDDGGGTNGLSKDATTALRDRRPLYSLFTAAGISQTGNAMTIVAGPWFVLQTTGSAAKTGLVGAAFALGLLMPILGGPLVDRLGFRRGSVVADLVSGATVALIPALHLAGVLAYWQIVVLVFILTSVNSQGDTARLALVPALARLADLPFKRANARDRAIIRLGSVVGPFLAGALIAGIGAVNVLFVDAGTFFDLGAACGCRRAPAGGCPRAAAGRAWQTSLRRRACGRAEVRTIQDVPVVDDPGRDRWQLLRPAAVDCGRPRLWEGDLGEPGELRCPGRLVRRRRVCGVAAVRIR